MRPTTAKSQSQSADSESQHSTPPSLPAQQFYFPSDRQFPLYAHSNSQRPRKPTRRRSSTNRRLPSRRNDLRPVDHRRPPLKQRRSSFALSDAFERGGGIELVVSPTLPSTSHSESAASITTTSSVKSRMRAVLVDLVHTVKARWNRSLPRINVVADPVD